MDRPVGYPSGYEVDVVLTDGATAHVRPILPQDGERLLAFHGRQSAQSIYYRYFSPRPRLSDKDVEHLTTVDYVDRMALVVLRGDELIGVSRYDRWLHRSEAEVAFFVDDANHGRGLATVLLEHLAVPAREVGLRAFTASVLPENRKMIGVFTQAGFEATTRFADGVVEVRLGLQPTPEAQAAIEDRARAAASEAVRRLLSPRSVAVIGASRRPGTVGHDVLLNLQRAGLQGPLWPVNPEATHVAGIPAVGSILDIPGEVDLAVIVVPAPQVAEVVEQCGRKQVYGAVILSSGFAETGPDGAALEAEVLRVARTWGVRVVGPNCLGIINTSPEVQLHATFAPVTPRRGRSALLSESGMVGAAIVGSAREAGLGLSSMVALGNRSDVSGNDLLQYWETDPDTEVVCMYIESFGNPRRFSRLARRLTRVKPVVAVKGGGGGETSEALLRQTGVIRVPTLTAMLDTTRLLIQQPIPSGPRVAVLGNAGGSLAIAVDAVVDAGLEVAEVLDLGLRATGPDVEAAVARFGATGTVDAVLMLYAPSLGGSATEVRDALEAGHLAHPDLVVSACFYGPLPDSPSEAGRGQVPVYGAVDAAARALGRAVAYGAWLARPEGTVRELGGEEVAAASGLVAARLAEQPSATLETVEATTLLAPAGLEVLAGTLVDDVAGALAAARRLGFPVVLKAAHREPMAKTAAAGFAIDLESEAAVDDAWTRMAASLGDVMCPVLVQPMIDPGVDVAVYVRLDDQVGPILALGPGGAAAALDQAVDVQVLPASDLDAERLVSGSRFAAVLDEVSASALVEVLERVGALVEAVPEVVGLELNPVILCRGEAILTQARVDLAVVEADPLPPVRRV